MRSGANAEPLRRVERDTLLAPGRNPCARGPRAARRHRAGVGLEPHADRVRSRPDPCGGHEPAFGGRGGRPTCGAGTDSGSLGCSRTRRGGHGAGSPTLPRRADPDPRRNPPGHGGARAIPGAGPRGSLARRARPPFRGSDGLAPPSWRRRLRPGAADERPRWRHPFGQHGEAEHRVPLFSRPALEGQCDQVKVWETLGAIAAGASDPALENGKKAPRLVISGAVKLLLRLGTRRSETLNMRWSDIDEHAQTWTVPGMFRKGGRTHVVPLPPLALRVLADLRPVTSHTPWVFVGKRGASLANNPARWTEILRKASGLDFTLPVWGQGSPRGRAGLQVTRPDGHGSAKRSGPGCSCPHRKARAMTAVGERYPTHKLDHCLRVFRSFGSGAS